jgi:MFS family permease
VAPLYAGGLLGPFGGGVVAAMLPEVAADLHTTTGTVTRSITAYLVPFAAVQLVSGTLGDRWGRRRTVRVAYLSYALASVACAVTPTIGGFLAFRAVQGAANAFTTPLLLAGLADLVPQRRLGRAVGVFASCQAAGQSFAPLVGGLAAEVDWRLAFVGITAASALLAAVPPPGRPRPGAAAPPWRALATARVGLVSAVAFAGFAGSAGLPFLVSLRAVDGFGVGAASRGLLLAGFGVSGLLLGPVSGRLVDRWGAPRCLAAAAVGCAGLVGSLGLIDVLGGLAADWVAAGAATSVLTVATNSLALSAVPANRAGAVSTMSAFRFAGGALAPVLWLPLYRSAVPLGFAVPAAVLLVVVLAATALWPARERARTPPVGSAAGLGPGRNSDESDGGPR